MRGDAGVRGRLPDTAGHAGRRIHAGRAERRARPHRREEDGDHPRPDLRHRQSPGRRRQHRRRDRRARRARRLYAADGQQLDPRHQCQPLQEDRLQSREGLFADLADRHAGQHPCGQSQGAGAHDGGADCACQGRARQAQLRLVGLWRGGASRRRIVQDAGRHRHRPCRLQGRGAGAAGFDRRARCR